MRATGAACVEAATIARIRSGVATSSRHAGAPRKGDRARARAASSRSSPVPARAVVRGRWSSRSAGSSLLIPNIRPPSDSPGAARPRKRSGQCVRIDRRGMICGTALTSSHAPASRQYRNHRHLDSHAVRTGSSCATTTSSSRPPTKAEAPTWTQRAFPGVSSLPYRSRPLPASRSVSSRRGSTRRHHPDRSSRYWLASRLSGIGASSKSHLAADGLRFFPEAKYIVVKLRHLSDRSLSLFKSLLGVHRLHVLVAHERRPAGTGVPCAAPLIPASFVP